MKSAACLVLTASLTAVAVPAAPIAAADGDPQLDRVYLRYAGVSRALRKFIVCAVDRNDVGARAIFSHPYGDAGQNQAIQDFLSAAVRQYCASGGGGVMRMTEMAAVGSVAEALLRRDQMPATVRKLNAQPVAGGGSFTWTAGRVSKEQELLHLTVAFCLVDTQPARIAQVLSADETTNSERQLFNAMTAEIQNCVPNGAQQTLQPMILRGALATAYLYASRPVDASSSAGAANDQNAQASER